MKRLHALVVTRRYWPHCDDGCHRLARLIGGLQRQGVRVNVLAPRYERRWPAEIRHREALVMRPLLAARSDWTTPRYLRQLGKWAVENVPRYDLVYCDTMRDDAAVFIQQAKHSSVPCVVRCGNLMGESDMRWQARSRTHRGAFRKCCDADAIIAPRASLQQALLAAGVPPAKIVRIGQGIGPPVNVTAASRKAARDALAHINSDLCVPQGGRVILCATRMCEAGQVFEVASAATALLNRHGRDRLWLIGDGPLRGKIFQQLKHEGLTRFVRMPGSFDHMEELMHAADVFVLPSADEGADWFWPLAIAAGLPAAVADCPDTRSFAGAAFAMMPSFPGVCPAAAFDVVQELLDSMEQASAEARKLRRQLTLAMPEGGAVDRHVQLFCRLTENRNLDSQQGAFG